MIVLLVVVAGLVALILAKSVIVVGVDQVGLVERLGRYKRSIELGLGIIAPFIDRVRKVDLRPEVIHSSTTHVLDDRSQLAVETTVNYQITDAVAATYQIADGRAALEQLTDTTLRNLFEGQELSDVRQDIRQHNEQLRSVLAEASAPWGIRIDNAEIKDVVPLPPS